MKSILLLIPVLASFFVTVFLLPTLIRRAKNAGLTGKDVHKSKNVETSESGGVTVVAGFALGVLIYLAIETFIFKSTSDFIEIFALLSCIFLIAFVAFTDDI